MAEKVLLKKPDGTVIYPQTQVDTAEIYNGAVTAAKIANGVLPTNFTGTDGVNAGTAGLVPAPLVADAGKFLKSDGTWASAGGATNTEVYVDAEELISMVSDPVNNYFCFYESFDFEEYEGSDPMTYSELTAAFNSGLVYVNIIYGEERERVLLSSVYRDGDFLDTQRLYGFVTRGAYGGGISTNDYGLVQWTYIHCSNLNSGSADAGTHFNATRSVNASQSHLDSMIQTRATAPTTSTVGIKGQIIEDSSSGTLYVCTNVSSTTPVVYTWEEVGGGGMFDVTISTTTGASWTSDKTYAQIVAAVTAGTPFNVRVDFPSMFTAAVNSVHYSPNDSEVYFGMSFDTGNGIITETITIDSSNNITATQETMPTVNNGTLTIQHNSTTKGTFTANQSTNSTINIETIYADTEAPTSAVGAVTTNNIADGAVTPAKISYSTESTSEQAVGTWIDGKTIYKKTYSGTYNAVANTTNNILTIAGISNIIDAKGYIADVDAKVAIGTLHMVGSGIAAAPVAMVAGTNLLVRCFTSVAGSNLPYAVTLYYTKS